MVVLTPPKIDIPVNILLNPFYSGIMSVEYNKKNELIIRVKNN